MKRATRHHKLQKITLPADTNKRLADDPNIFYWRFEKNTITSHTHPSPPTAHITPLMTPLSPPSNTQTPITICEEDVKWFFQRRKIRKAPGPDSVSSPVSKHVLINCGHEFFERLVLAYLKNITEQLLEPLQFMY